MDECTRIDVLGVPVDVVKPENLEDVIFSLYEKAGTKQIVFLSIWGLLRAKRSDVYMQCLKNAALVLPISKSIVKGATFLKKSAPVRYNPFSTIISILTSLESRYKSIYLLGGKKSSLMDSERNIRATYPGLQIVGRYVGYYPKSVEKDIISAVYKANPALVLVGDGIRHGEMWAFENRNQFGTSFFIYYKDVLDILSARKKRISKETFEKGKEIWSELIRNPLKIFLIFSYMWYKILLLGWRLFKTDKKTTA
ncbi:MAG: WecB/TagA/CpsF family glycosyltransferase [Spirochaetaceae bacterium]|nr:WecB/TagA/CpsF family glycosyltransferase [Spirochaetaceae bacterium]MBO4706519.1 WecB/TagA/CpsF family glycosyltransferase [Spirochaetaceae bacterium]